MEAVFLKLLNMSITASYLVFGVILLRLVLNKAPKSIRVILWGIVALRLIIPFSFESIFSLIPSSEPLPQEFLYAPTPQVNTGFSAVDQAMNPLISQSLTPAVGASANPTHILSFIFSQVWILGMVLMVGYALVSYLLLRRKVAASMKLDCNLRLCDHISSPFILGMIRPVIYLPSELDPATADLVLAHEYAHLKRRDHWWKPLGFVLLCVYWFNPVMWIAYILLCRDIELACDERVIQEMGTDIRTSYSEALLRCSISRNMIAACPLAFGEVGVKDRIKSVLHYKKPAFWILLIAAIICIVFAVCFLTDPVKKIDPLTLDDWGITVTARDPSPTGVTLAYKIPENLDGQITIPSNQVLLQLVDGNWIEANPIIPAEDVVWDFIIFVYPDYEAEYQQVEWYSIYGEVPPGQYRIRKTLWLYQDGMSYEKDFYADFSIPMKERISEGTYAVSELLYRNPLSSYFPDESDTPATVKIHSGCDILTAYGGTLEENPNIIWGWRKLDESWEDVVFALRLLEHEGKLTLSEDTLYQKISEHYHLLQLGEEVLLVHSEHDETVWSVYRLVKAQPIGSENMTLYSEYGHDIRILESKHYSNAVSLQLRVTFPEGIELSDRDVPYPQDVWLYYATESGRTHATAMSLQSSIIDKETHSIIYDIVFSLHQEPPNGKEFTLSISGFRTSLETVLFQMPLSMTWSAEVTDAAVYEYKDDEAHIHMVLSPLAIHINAKGTNFQSMDDLFNSVCITDFSGNQSTTLGSYGGSEGGNLINLEIFPATPIQMNQIHSIYIGDYSLPRQGSTAFNGNPTIENAIDSLRQQNGILQIELSHGEDLILGSHGGWDTRNDTQYAGSLRNYSYVPVSEEEFPTGLPLITLKFGHEGKICYLKFADNSNLIKMHYDGISQYYRAESSYGDPLTVGEIMRKWYDTAEHEAQQGAVIPLDPKTDYVSATQLFCDAYYGTHMQVPEESMFRYDFVKCETEVDMTATNLARTRGELDENSYAFWVTVTFLPGNGRSADECMAGNTHDYTGSDPDVPNGALQYHMCGYLYLTADGWVGQILGTGF